ncbi:MAG: glycosyltransferase family 4 protein [Acidobacteria bacterium]|nr:glycosyltransferase family 4 protein [Acidobacteriota bacterium]
MFAVAPRRIGGIEMYARELSAQLYDSGWESVLCFAAEPPPVVRGFLDHPGVSLEVMPPACSWLSDRSAMRCLWRLLDKHQPEVLHVHFTGAISAIPWLARWHSVPRNYLTDHSSRAEDFHDGRLSPWRRAAARLLNWPLTGVIAVSEYNAGACRRSGAFDPGRVTRIYNGVDTTLSHGDPAAFRRRYGIPGGRPIVLQVSWIIPEKGISDLIDAAALVRAEIPDVHFVVAGDGMGMEEYRARAEKAGLGDHVTWTGLLTDPICDGAFAAADVVCQLSRWQEAFGFVIIEAMACGKPLVATRVGGIPEIVQDGVTGYLVERRRPDQAAAKLIHLLSHPQLAGEMGAAGRGVVAERFDLRSGVRRLIDLYGIADHAIPRAMAACS